MQAYFVENSKYLYVHHTDWQLFVYHLNRFRADEAILDFLYLDYHTRYYECQHHSAIFPCFV